MQNGFYIDPILHFFFFSPSTLEKFLGGNAGGKGPVFDSRRGAPHPAQFILFDIDNNEHKQDYKDKEDDKDKRIRININNII